jgi:hypothetical protein
MLYKTEISSILKNNSSGLCNSHDRFVKRFNFRKHQGVGRKKPVNLYLNAA